MGIVNFLKFWWKEDLRKIFFEVIPAIAVIAIIVGALAFVSTQIHIFVANRLRVAEVAYPDFAAVFIVGIFWIVAFFVFAYFWGLRSRYLEKRDNNR